MDLGIKRKIPKKYHKLIKEVYADEDGYWCHLNNGYIWTDDATVVNGENIKQLIEALSEVKKLSV